MTETATDEAQLVSDAEHWGIVEAARRAGLGVAQAEAVVRRSGNVPARPGELRSLELKPVVEARLVELASWIVDDAEQVRAWLTEGVWLHNWYQGELHSEYVSTPTVDSALKTARTVATLVETAVRCVRDVQVLRLEDNRTADETRAEALDVLDELARRRAARASGNGSAAVAEDG